MPFDWSDVDETVREGEARYWQMNAILYALCDTLGSNTEEAAVYAKTMIVGRTYQTRIEAITGWSKKGGKRNEKPIDRVCKAILGCVELDDQIDAIRCMGDCPISEQSISPVIRAHSLLCNALKKFSRGNEARSFASKYLHFHARSVPIYDSVAAAVVKLWCKPSQWNDIKSSEMWKEMFKKHSQFPSQPYARHCHMLALMAKMWQTAKVKVPTPTARNLDTYLMACGN
ncbi:MAG: hypothetical protein KBG84_12225 [Planctomycetes bacterium]|nr:hypothetical protein [Planctomycetota bacterium]